MLKISQDLAEKDFLCQINQLINNQIYAYNLKRSGKKRFAVLN